MKTTKYSNFLVNTNQVAFIIPVMGHSQISAKKQKTPQEQTSYSNDFISDYLVLMPVTISL